MTETWKQLAARMEGKEENERILQERREQKTRSKLAGILMRALAEERDLTDDEFDGVEKCCHVLGLTTTDIANLSREYSKILTAEVNSRDHEYISRMASRTRYIHKMMNKRHEIELDAARRLHNAWAGHARAANIGISDLKDLRQKYPEVFTDKGELLSRLPDKAPPHNPLLDYYAVGPPPVCMTDNKHLRAEADELLMEIQEAADDPGMRDKIEQAQRDAKAAREAKNAKNRENHEELKRSRVRKHVEREASEDHILVCQNRMTAAEANDRAMNREYHAVIAGCMTVEEMDERMEAREADLATSEEYDVSKGFMTKEQAERAEQNRAAICAELRTKRDKELQREQVSEPDEPVSDPE